MKALIIAALLWAGVAYAEPSRTISKNGITMTACEHDAHAFCSLVWGGMEFINDYDHGRQLQSAVTFGQGEDYNPTEAGANYFVDGVNPSPSSSKLLRISYSASWLQTTTNMAFWKPVNGQKLSGYILIKDVTIGKDPNLPNVIDYYVTFYNAPNTNHTFVQYEALTAYMPPHFNRFYALNGNTVEELTDGPGEQPHPVFFCNSIGSHCMGAYARGLPQPEYPGAGYGRWRFVGDSVVKWNMVFRFNGDMANGPASFGMQVVVGNYDTVVATLKAVRAKYQ